MTAVTVDAEHIAAVREFNRRYTRLIGVLQEHLVDSDFSLTEARILFELAHFGPLEVVRLRQDLDLDPGYLSRILARFEQAGLVLRRRSEQDGRRQLAELTEQGRTVFADLDRRSNEGVSALLATHSPAARTRLIHAMHTIERILDGRAAAPFTIRDPHPGDYGWVVQRNAALYAAEYGWDLGYEALVTRIVADYLESHEPQTERAWIADADGQPVGCVFCMREDDTTARLRLLLVEPSARGLGVGTALVEECLRFATGAGYRAMVLWTNDALAAARRIYERAGFELVDSEPHHSFGRNLVAQTWRRTL
ncbi:bifunctional helix-turn-helix transcriptional regulator/GNAT family N-acetyltransferase [Nocardia sp. CDC159]|uniref:Bifunctional helix-turn-helix transcriptional regulator/GNAT family N-acetyltransferase n=1 Tax=Nocardia pulmonis TaxID=2951408 RepID=A0A9X2IUW3_9NOCA|nr:MULTISPECIES: bifunctional helix-turn-helix transcriptional regulator/GNAT family N-acetyltransferase [Nocardia]MCM6773272.1 bifunctional helix-turn-helix transcriptional regulator/GNAT family N-acetyltransferase [Nocardia pulmonis]MCM6786159.1 bifunctional helix-turn-helix transcriptional regulator/GNAT family N-acetyltransferase [Nocardia sp. CDC159]